MKILPKKGALKNKFKSKRYHSHLTFWTKKSSKNRFTCTFNNFFSRGNFCLGDGGTLPKNSY